MSYSRYGGSGFGLSDRRQSSYNFIQRKKSMMSVGTTSGVFSQMADVRAAMQMHKAHFVPGTLTPRGGSQGDVSGLQGKAAFQSYQKPGKVASQSQFGMHTANVGVRRGYPPWVMQMLGKGTELGKPPGVEGGVSDLIVPAGLVYALWKVLL